LIFIRLLLKKSKRLQSHSSRGCDFEKAEVMARLAFKRGRRISKVNSVSDGDGSGRGK
jgi:hypothetical protein